MFFRRIKKDKYLKNFVEYCRKRYGDNLIGIIIFGSYALGYFDVEKSDYDLFVIFKNNAPDEKEFIMKEFKRISPIYFMSENDLIVNAHFGHFASYITLLKSGRIIYGGGELRKFLKRLKGVNLFEKLVDVGAVEAKTVFEVNELKKKKGYNAIKWVLPSIRKRLQLLSFLRFRRLVWDLEKNLYKNKDIFSNEEVVFIKGLNDKMFRRENQFGTKERKKSVDLIYKLNLEILENLKKVL